MSLSGRPGRTARMPAHIARRPSRQSAWVRGATGGTAKLPPVSAKMPSISAETSMLTRSPASIRRSPGMPWAMSGKTEMQVAPGKS
jgi:hypothetical protein